MEFFKEKSGIILHLLGWSILAVIFFVLFPMMYKISLPIEHYIYHFILFSVLFIVYYVNSKLILSRVIWRKNGIIYLVFFIIFTVGLIVFMNQIEHILQLNFKIHQRLHPNQVYNSSQNLFFISVYISIFSLLIFLVGIANHLIKSWNNEQTKKLELKVQKSKAELDTLKAQINPHFFFNTLNTIHSLTYFEVDKSRIAIQQLAKMMRFVMNEEKLNKVSLNDEISFIENYIDLMRFRLTENIRLKIDFSIPENDVEIAPMILLPFVENAFQHGISTDINCEIELIFKLDLEDKTMVLKTKNQQFTQQILTRKKGIGIENTLKRLNIIYPNQFEYLINNDEIIYECFLKIKLA